MTTRGEHGPWQLLDELGRGGMGVVWRARHRDTGELAALKTLRASRSREIAAIRREIHTLGRLRHPGIVRILDSGEDAAGPWYAMELVVGISLHERLQSSSGEAAVTFSLDEPGIAPAAEPIAAWSGDDEVLALFGRLCDALAAVHAAGLVHRDLKPGNVLLRPDGTPVLVDFGLSIGRAGFREGLRSAVEAVAGTLAYMPPEQARGEPVDARADLYALGCMLYEAVTGRPPYVAGSATGLVRAHANELPVPPSERTEGVPRALDDLIVRLLAKDPAERPASAGEVGDAIEALRGRERVSADAGVLFRPRFTGRDPLVGSVRSGFVLLEGESGAGKTRTAAEALGRARVDGTWVMLGECAPPGPAPEPLRPIAQALGPVVERLRDRGERWLAEAAPVIAPWVPGARGLAEGRSPPPLPPGAARLRLFEALDRVLEAVAGERGAMLVVDDVQWADELTLAYLERLARSRPAGVGVLALVRAEEAERVRRIAEQVPVLRVERLTAEAERALVEGMLGAPAPDALIEEVAAARGNPLIAAEIVRAAHDGGRLVRERGRWRLVGDRPPEAGDLVARRLLGLGPPARALVAAAAVVGREADADVLAAIAGLPDDAASEGAAELLARQVLDEPEPGRMRFVHDRLREVAAAALGDDERVRLHARAARVLHHADPAVVAHHLDHAGEAEAAAQRYAEAARAAVDRLAPEEAERLYRASLRLADDVAVRLELVKRVLLFVGAAARVIPEAEQALALARAAGDRVHEARALEALARAHVHVSGLQAALAFADTYERIARELGPEELALALAVRGTILSTGGRTREAAEVTEREIALRKSLGAAGERGASLLGAAYARAALALRDVGELARSRALFTEAIAIHDRDGDVYVSAVARNNLAGVLLYEGDTEGALSLLHEALAVHEAIGTRLHEAYTLHDIAETHGERRELEEARKAYERAAARCRELGEESLRAFCEVGLANVDIDSGAADRARERAQRARAAFTALGQERFAGVALTAEARATAALGADPSDVAERALAIHRAHQNVGGEAEILALLARWRGAPGAPDAALAERARERARASGFRVLQDQIERLLASR